MIRVVIRIHMQGQGTVTHRHNEGGKILQGKESKLRVCEGVTKGLKWGDSSSIERGYEKHTWKATIWLLNSRP